MGTLQDERRSRQASREVLFRRVEEHGWISDNDLMAYGVECGATRDQAFGDIVYLNRQKVITRKLAPDGTVGWSLIGGKPRSGDKLRRRPRRISKRQTMAWAKEREEISRRRYLAMARAAIAKPVTPPKWDEPAIGWGSIGRIKLDDNFRRGVMEHARRQLLEAVPGIVQSQVVDSAMTDCDGAGSASTAQKQE
ncbi:MAG: hypothetical protein HY332_23925 [Chloroflexi bacterium]|nr:hypothetical protein [Chloroflexota bacterium]